MKPILFLLLFISATAYSQSDQAVLDAGIGVSDSKGTRSLSVGCQEDFWGSVKQRAMIGGWGGQGSGVFAGVQLGFEVNRDNTIIGVFSGPNLVSSSGNLIGGYFQFVTDFHVGIQDPDSNYIGVIYRHISSAGLESPNIGVDSAGVEIRF